LRNNGKHLSVIVFHTRAGTNSHGARGALGVGQGIPDTQKNAPRLRIPWLTALQPALLGSIDTLLYAMLLNDAKRAKLK
jgi:hypothetical protein